MVEEQIDYVIGSGNHARSYLHRGPDGRTHRDAGLLVCREIGVLGDEPGVRSRGPGRFPPRNYRRVPALPQWPAAQGQLSGARHHRPLGLPQRKFLKGLIASGAMGRRRPRARGSHRQHSREKIRQAIVNPARLSRDRQLEVCLQCHLETSSSLMPNEIRRFNRDIDSYQPGEPIGDYKIYFDRASGGKARRFEIAHAAYRLRMSGMLSLQPDDLPYLPRSSPVLPYFDIDGSLPGGLPGLPPGGRSSSEVACGNGLHLLPHAKDGGRMMWCTW